MVRAGVRIRVSVRVRVEIKVSLTCVRIKEGIDVLVEGWGPFSRRWIGVWWYRKRSSLHCS